MHILRRSASVRVRRGVEVGWEGLLAAAGGRLDPMAARCSGGGGGGGGSSGGGGGGGGAGAGAIGCGIAG